MVFLLSIKSENVKRKVKNVFTLLVLCLYIAGISGISRLHQVVHTHETVSHTDETEKDPCHRALYHHDFDHGCEHDAHFTFSDKCDVCDLILHAEYVYAEVSINTAAAFSSGDIVRVIEDIYTSGNICLPARAPPFVV